MSRLAPWLFGAALAVLAHVATVAAVPYALTGVAMKRIAERGAGVNAWSFSPPVDAANQSIVRSSPDLLYAACVYDLSDGPVRVTVAPGADYVSVSVFAPNSDNVFVLNDRQAPGGFDLLLTDDPASAPKGPWRVVEAPRRGLVLQRRLASGAEATAAALAARAGDRCGSLPRS